MALHRTRREGGSGRGRRLRIDAKSEGVFAGTSTGGNVTTAIRVGQRLGPDATVVTVMCDSGIKCLSTALYGTGPKSGAAR